MKIAILGAGAFGTALGGVLADNGCDIDYYDTRIEKERLCDVVADAKYILLVVPSNAAPFVLPYVPKDTPLIVATKGILTDKAFRDFKDYMVLSGPGFAQDIKDRKMTLLTATDKRILELFSTSYLKFDYTDDKLGVLMCGALKNVYALFAGLQDLRPETPEMQKYIDSASLEMKQILEANGASAKTVDLSCGIGDLILTCSPRSRNYEFGQILRKNPHAEPEKTVEGLSALKRIIRKEIVLPEGLGIINELIERSKEWD